MKPDHELRAARDARIRSIEDRITRRNPIGVKAPIALLGIASCVVLLWMERADLSYWFSRRAPTVIGREGDYHLERLRSNSYVQVHGLPTLRGEYSIEHGETFVVVGLRDTPLVVHRRALASERWQPGRTPPQPDQRSFAVGGRLMAQEEATPYRAAFEHMSAMGEVKPLHGRLWMIYESESPGDDRGVLGVGAVLIFFIGLNAWFLMRGLARRR